MEPTNFKGTLGDLQDIEHGILNPSKAIGAIHGNKIEVFAVFPNVRGMSFLNNSAAIESNKKLCIASKKIAVALQNLTKKLHDGGYFQASEEYRYALEVLKDAGVDAGL